MISFSRVPHTQPGIYSSCSSSAASPSVLAGQYRDQTVPPVPLGWPCVGCRLHPPGRSAGPWCPHTWSGCFQPVLEICKGGLQAVLDVLRAVEVSLGFLHLHLLDLAPGFLPVRPGSGQPGLVVLGAAGLVGDVLPHHCFQVENAGRSSVSTPSSRSSPHPAFRQVQAICDPLSREQGHLCHRPPALRPLL